MAQIKISELDAVSALTDNDVLPIVNSNDTKKVSISQLKTKLTEDISSLSFLIVQTLPTEDISTSIIYLVPKTATGTNDSYYEYVYINNAWEMIGETQIDLSNYYTKSETDSAINTAISSSITDALGGSY